MVLLGLDSLLLSYITLGTGIYTVLLLEKIFKQTVQAKALGVFLAGLVFCTIYFNIVSFWLPINYYTLVPLFITASVIFALCKQQRTKLIAAVKKNMVFIASPRNLIFTIPVIALLFYYWVIPPINADSGFYHYSTILWYEKYKAIPGLANVHGRFAFNAASFIIQAAYSFTGLIGHHIYPLNAVLICMLILWVVIRILKNKNSFLGLLYGVLFMLLCRTLLLDMSSPSSDALFMVCLCYIFIGLLDALATKTLTLSSALLPLVLLVYVVIAKLAAASALLLVPFILYLLRKQQKLLPLTVKLFAISLPIYLPWLCRNVILCGYLIYPLPYIDVFTVDWKVPKNVLMLDYLYIKHLSKLFCDDITYLRTLPFYQWFYRWFTVQFSSKFSQDFVIFLAAVFSPLYWILVYTKNKKIYRPLFVFWLILYACVWFWITSSPAYRFGMIFMTFAMLAPFLCFSFTKVYKQIPLVLAVLITVVATVFIHDGYNKNSSYQYTPKDYWLFPLKDKRYYYKNNINTFPYIMLGNGIRLYYEDSVHECINASLPCMSWYYGNIEMRGAKIEDGFRNKTDEVIEHFPFVK